MRRTWRSLVLSTAAVIFGFSLVLLPGCGGAVDPWGVTSKKRVLTTIVPLHCFAATIAGDDAEVRCLSTGAGPHDFQYTPGDARLLSTADVFIVNGLGLEDFLDPLLKSSGNHRVKVVRTGEKIPAQDRLQADGTPHLHGDKLVSHKGDDPHVWLGVEEATIQVEAIRDALIEVDPAHQTGYRGRADTLIAELRGLKETAKNLKLPGGLVTFHDSFRYFGRSFGIQIADAIRTQKGEDIGLRELNEKAEKYRKLQVGVIGVEPQYKRTVAENLAKAVGPHVKVIELDPIETAPTTGAYRVDKNYYLETMKKNLQNLKQVSP